MEDGWQEPYRVVCYNIEIAQAFIKKAEQGGIPPDVSQRACLIIAAGALWSAVDIFNEKVVGGKDIGSRLNSKKGKRTNTTNWFKEHERLVDQIRNGAVLATRPPSGVGQTVGPATEVSIFVWVKTDDGDYQDIPIAEVLSRLNKVADQIKEHALGVAKTWYITFN